jgi:hypothetical protein
VVLVLPFLEADDQARLFKPGTHFERPSEQEDFMRTWLDQVRDRRGSSPRRELLSWGETRRLSPRMPTALPERVSHEF